MVDILKKIGKYFWNFFKGFDQWVNTWFGGDPDETISSRVGKWYKASVLEWIINHIFFWQKNHCEEAIEPDEGDDAIIK